MPTARPLRWAASAALLLLVAFGGWLVATGVAPREDVAARADGVVEQAAVTAAPTAVPTAAPTAADPTGPSPTTAPATGAASEAAPSDVPDPATPDADALAGVLPGEVPQALSGELVVAAGSSPAPGSGRVMRVRVEAERGLPVDVDAFAAFVMTTLNDGRGWGADGSVTFARTDGEADIRVLVASPATVDAMCAPLRTNGKWSCGRYGHAALNANRWVDGSDAFNAASGGDLLAYRQYLVNHEVGHLLGHQHTGCPGAGLVAPVMLQQSIRLDGCLPNGWPHP